MPEEKLKAGLSDLTNCKKFFNNVVFIPINATVPKKEVDIMIKRMLGIVNRYQLLAEYMSKVQNRPLDAKITPPLMAQAKL